jgi:hypothetical protein
MRRRRLVVYFYCLYYSPESGAGSNDGKGEEETSLAKHMICAFEPKLGA